MRSALPFRVTPIHECAQPKCKRSARRIVSVPDESRLPKFEVCDTHVEWAKHQIVSAQ